jgi:hypothetical protein
MGDSLLRFDGPVLARADLSRKCAQGDGGQQF